MDELRKNHIVQITTRNSDIIDGIILDYAKDRVMILVAFDSLENAKKIRELDELMVKVNTHLGIKQMKSLVLAELNSNNCLIIENTDSIPVVQKREHVRVVSNITFSILHNQTKSFCFCVNISAGGIAFICHDYNFKIDENVQIMLPESEFEKEIFINATIIKANGVNFVAKYNNLKPFDEDKLVKYVFKMISKK